MKKKGLIITGISVAVVIVVAVILTIVLWPKKDSKTVYTEAIKDSISISRLSERFNLGEKGEKLEKVLDSHILKLVLEGNSNGSNSENGKMEFYVTKDQIYGLIDATVNGKALNMDMLMKDNKLYYYVKDAFTRYYYVDMNSLFSSSISQGIDVEKIEGYLVDSFTDVINGKNLVKDSSEVTINSKKYNADKYSYTFTGSDAYEVIQKFIGKVKNDKQLISQITEIIKSSGQNTNISIEQELDSLLKEAETVKQLEKVFTYTVYLNSKDEVISTVISADIDMGGQSLPVVLVINDVIDNGLAYEQVYISAMGQRLYELVVNQTSSDNIDLAVNAMGQSLITGKITKTDKNLRMKISGSSNLPQTLDIDVNLNVVSDVQMNGTISYTVGEEKGNYNVRIEEVNSFPQVDVSNSAPIDQMTDAEKEALNNLRGSSDNYIKYDYEPDNGLEGY